MPIDKGHVGRHSTPGVSCFRCARPRAKSQLRYQDGHMLCELCLKSHGRQELLSMPQHPLFPLGATFGGGGPTRFRGIPPDNRRAFDPDDFDYRDFH